MNGLKPTQYGITTVFLTEFQSMNNTQKAAQLSDFRILFKQSQVLSVLVAWVFLLIGKMRGIKLSWVFVLRSFVVASEHACYI